MMNPQLLKDLGKRISAQRRLLGFTQEQIAEQMNVSVQMISNLELGHKAIRPENLVKISSILRVSTDYLLFGHSSPGESSELATKIHSLTTEQQSAVNRIIDLFLESNK